MRIGCVVLVLAAALGLVPAAVAAPALSSLIVERAAGAPVVFRVKDADTPDARAVGLMRRAEALRIAVGDRLRRQEASPIAGHP